MNIPARALTIWQPWASLYACGLKRFETRSWKTDYRGPLIIHAAKKWGPGHEEFVKGLRWYFDNGFFSDVKLTEEQRNVIHQVSYGPTLGKVVGVCILEDCQEMGDGGSELENELGNFGTGRFGWKARDPHLFRNPVEATGKQGLWLPDEDLVARVRREYEKTLEA